MCTSYVGDAELRSECSRSDVIGAAALPEQMQRPSPAWPTGARGVTLETA
jgi:hypothetical protein